MSSSGSLSSSQIAVGVAAAAGLGVACAAAAASREGIRTAARKQAACPFEYHVAVHTSTGKCVLAKVHKAGGLSALREAVASALRSHQGEAAQVDVETLQLRPVQRTSRGRARLLEPLTETSGLASFEGLLAERPGDQLQVVELVCADASSSMPVSVPLAPTPFPEPGWALPLMGHTYHLMGREEIYTYNITDSIFPPGAPQYPYGATVRSYSGGVKSSIQDFPAGTVFHPDAETYTTWTADPKVIEELLARIADFPKLWNRPAQVALQDLTGNGLFTSSETSEDWKAGHSILPCGFNQIKVKSFAPHILAKTRTFILEWSAYPAGHKVEGVNHWLTAMTADAVVRCSMGLDMRNVERMGRGEAPHPFIDNFRLGLGYFGGSVTTKSEYGWKRFLPGFGAKAKLQARYEEAKKALHSLVDQMVEQTRAGELGGQDSIIRAMLQDKASSGAFVRYGNLYGHVINLMIAGHETTAATLGFTLQLLAENPQYEARALEEVRTVLQGRTEPTADDVPKLQFVEQCFREALRLYSPVTMLSRDVAFDTLLQGHRVLQGERIGIVTRALHTNPEHWGGEFGDTLSYNPDRFSPEAVRKRHPNAYHPWGFGTRACIGSQFALFEAKTFLASMLLHFKLVPVPGFKLRASLEAGGAAPSPAGLEFLLYPRPGGPLCAPDGSMLRLSPLASTGAEAPKPSQSPSSRGQAQAQEQAQEPAGGGAQMLVLFGSNSGASQEFASQTAAAARKAGFSATTSTLDAALQAKSILPDGRLVIVVTATYNGNPPDNAAKFKSWMLSQKEGSLTGMPFAVFGVGNSQWQTYQQFPREIDAALERCGATRLHTLGACDVDGPSFESDFEEWLSGLLRAVGGASTQADDAAAADTEFESAALEFVVAEPSGTELLSELKPVLHRLEADRKAAEKTLGIDREELRMTTLEVVSPSRELCQQSNERSVRHITLRLPEGAASYRAGDHLEVLPQNDPGLVKLVLETLGLQGNTAVCWDRRRAQRSNRSARDADDKLRPALPLLWVAAELIVGWIPDLAAVPSRKSLARLARTAAEPAKGRLTGWAEDQELYKNEVVSPQMSLAEVLQLCKGHLSLSLGQLCALAKPLVPRYYSVSSSPLGSADPRVVTASVGRVEFKTGTGRVHRGLASTTLAGLQQGDVLPGCVRTLSGNFHLPQDPLAPILMVGPGTGIAPMMGFLQERAHLLKTGKKLGPAILFFGCRRADEDYLYREELADFLAKGVLSQLHLACSREGPQKVYVQDKIIEQRAQVWQLMQQSDSRVFVCGDARAMAPDVRRAFQRVAAECGGRSEAKAASLVAAMVEGGRYLEDVWAS